MISSRRGRAILAGFFIGLLSNAAPAAESIRVVLEFTPNLDNGRRTFEICSRCHLPEAWGNGDGTYPQLAGQHVNVLMKQLLAIRDGRRSNPTMQPFVQERTIGGYQNLADVVAYISTLPMNPSHTLGPWPPGSPEYRAGEQTYNRYCAACHGVSGEGNNALSYPRLQGQHFSYMARQVRLAREKIRSVDQSMALLFDEVPAEDFDRALNYVSYLPVPQEDLAPDPEWRNPDFNQAE